jgi:dienelactone hydrolase
MGAGQEDDRVITDLKRSIHVFFWQYDSQHVLYQQEGHLYQTNVRTKLTRDLTPFQGIRVRGFYERANWYGDPRYPHQSLVQMNLLDRTVSDVYRIDLETGAVELDTKNPWEKASFAVDHDYQVRAAQVGDELHVRDGPESSWRLLWKIDPEDDLDGFLGFTSDNECVYLRASLGASALGVVKLNLETGERAVLAGDPQYHVARVLLHPVNQTLEAVSFIRQRMEWSVVEEAVTEDFEALARIRGGDFDILSRDLQNNRWTINSYVDDGPDYCYLYHRKQRRADFLFSIEPQLDEFRFSREQPISFQARDGMKLYGYLTLPLGLEAENLPMVVLVHGGPAARDYWGFEREVQWLANRGYAVLQVNFRGSTGYGRKYYEAGHKEWGGKMQTDLVDGKNWAVKQGYADPNRVCIMGHSYGGYAALAALAFNPDEFACGVAESAISSLITHLENLPPEREQYRQGFYRRIGNLETERDLLRSRSPLYYADQIKKPLLIAQGAEDRVVRKAEADQIVEVMRKNNQSVEYLVFPDEGHTLTRPENRMKLYAAVESFLSRYLGGRVEAMEQQRKSDSPKHLPRLQHREARQRGDSPLALISHCPLKRRGHKAVSPANDSGRRVKQALTL